MFGKTYQVLQVGVEYHVCGEEYNVDRRERGSNIIFPIILRLFERILSKEEGKGRKFWGRKSRFKKKWGWGRISSCRKLFFISGFDLGL